MLRSSLPLYSFFPSYANRHTIALTRVKSARQRHGGSSQCRSLVGGDALSLMGAEGDSHFYMATFQRRHVQFGSQHGVGKGTLMRMLPASGLRLHFSVHVGANAALRPDRDGRPVPPTRPPAVCPLAARARPPPETATAHPTASSSRTAPDKNTPWVPWFLPFCWTDIPLSLAYYENAASCH